MKTNTWHKGWLALLAALLPFVAAVAWSQPDRLDKPEGLAVAAFSALKAGAQLPENWKPLGVSNSVPRTRYTLASDGGVTVIKAEANASASGLSRDIRVNLAEYPVFKWRWKVSNVLKASDINTKEGDDYPARVYVMFDYPLEKLSFGDRTKLRMARALHDPNLPAATLCYVWDGKAAAGTIVPSSYTNLMRMIVVESGVSRVNRWLEVERDVAADFRAAFGLQSSDDIPPVSAVAIATDMDNTGEVATAFFGDISFNKQKVSK